MTKRLLVTMVLLLAFGVMLVGDRTQAQKVVSSSCPEPSVGVESVQIVGACGGGNEYLCVKVKWNVKGTVPAISGFTVDLAATPTAAPTTPQKVTKEVNGNLREATLGIFTASLQGGPFKADVKAKYEGCVIASKAGTF